MDASASTPDATRTLLRHTLATLAYRAAKVLRGTPDSFAQFSTDAGTRTPAQLLAHMGDLFDWALSMAQGTPAWHDSTPLPWPDECARFFRALSAFDAFLSSDAALGRPVEMLFQGPVADALTHTGQLAILRRLAGNPVRGENYARADIQVGRVTSEQAPPRAEFG